jgi:hypothetical protein
LGHKLIETPKYTASIGDYYWESPCISFLGAISIDWLDVVRQPTDTAKIEISTDARPILRLHHPRPSPPKPPRLRRNEYYTNHDRASRHYFRGARRRRLC